MLTYCGLTLRPSATAELFCHFPWQDTPLGPVDDWSAAARSTVQLCLNSAFPMTLCLGDALRVIYNDGYLPIMGRKHPASFGQPVREVYAEIADFIDHSIAEVMTHNRTLHARDQLLPLARAAPSEGLQESYFTFCYNPLRNEHGHGIGVLAMATETTATVLEERRQRLLQKLSELMVAMTAQRLDIHRLQAVLTDETMDLASTTLLTVTANGEVTTRWQQGPTPPDTETRARALRIFSQLEPDGTTLVPVGSRCLALMMRQPALQFGYLLLVTPAPAVVLDQRYQEFLDLIREVISGGVHRALSEREAHEHIRRQLDQREHLYRAVFEFSDEAIIISDTEGRVLTANPAASLLTGYAEAELQAQGMKLLMPKTQREPLAHALRELTRCGHFEGTLRLRRRSNSELLVDLSANRLQVPTETGPEQIISLLRDADHRLQAEERLTSTARLQALGQLARGVSQDFNNLLSVMLLGAEALADHARQNASLLDTTRLVLSAVQRAMNLTHQLLAFSQQRPMQREPFNLDQLVEELIPIVQRSLGAEIALETRIAHDLQLDSDASQLHNALLNLCLNARDAMPEGGRLHISATRWVMDTASAQRLDVEPGSYARLRVIDSGTGIDPTRLPRVIEPFYTTKVSGRGTGLGLSMVYGYIRQSGGALDIRSDVGSGTEVTLYLPLSTRLPPSDTAEVTADLVATAALRSEHILLLVPDRLLEHMLTQLLTACGHVVMRPEQAEAAAVDTPGWIIADTDAFDRDSNARARLDGFATRFPQARVLLLCGHSLDDSPAQLLTVRAQLLAKPVGRARLLQSFTAGPLQASEPSS